MFSKYRPPAAQTPGRRSQRGRRAADAGDAASVSAELENALRPTADCEETFAASTRRPRKRQDDEDDEIQRRLLKWRARAQRPPSSTLCMARTWKGVQCEKKPCKGSEFCATHAKTGHLTHGQYGSHIAEAALEKLLLDAAKCEKVAGFK